MYELAVSSRARREFKRLAHRDRDRISTAIRGLRHSPRPPGSLKLKGLIFRIRVGGFRVIYAVSDRERRVVIVKIDRREKDTYDDIDRLF